MTNITVILSSANLGDVAEGDFDAWASWVARHIDEAVGFEVAAVEQRRFGEAGEDLVRGGDPEQREAILDWLAHEGWDQFCADFAAWPPREE